MPEGTTQDDLHAQIAQRLFGWTWGRYAPAYTTDPAATARVWQWVEQGHGVREISYEYAATQARITCTLYGREGLCLMQEGATWPEALCRAALALAAAVETA